MEEKKSFIIYCDWETLFDSLNSTEEAGELIKALFAFAKRGEMAEFTGALKMAFAFMSQQIAKDAEKWEAARAIHAECGKLGGRPRKSSTENQKNQTEPKKPNITKQNQKNQTEPKKAVNVNVNDNVILKENYTKEKNAQTLEAIINDYTQNAELINAIYDFIKFRKAIKAPLTDRALQLNLNKLDKMATDEGTKMAIINQSIERGWKSFYNLKEPEQEKEAPADMSKYDFVINNF